MTILLNQSYFSDIHPDELGIFECMNEDGDYVGYIDNWWMVNDGNADCPLGEDEGFDYDNWPQERIYSSFNNAKLVIGLMQNL